MDKRPNTEKNRINIKDIARNIGILFAIYIFVTALFTGFLVLSAYVPADREHFLSSAETMKENTVFFDVIEGVESSKIDRYADSILINIAWNFDSEDALRSVMLSQYYYQALQNENDNLYDAVTEHFEPNMQYVRYWHGSAGVVRLLLSLTDIKGIYVLFAILIAGSWALLAISLMRIKLWREMIALCSGLICTGVWFVPMSLEYSWMFIVAPVIAIIALALAYKKKYRGLMILFMISGMVTNYLDFLTTETLTLLVPLAVIVHIVWVNEKERSYKFFASWSGVWFAGYALTWMTKWFMAGAVLDTEIMPLVSGHIEERMSVDSRFFDGILRNIACLFPFDYGTAGKIIAIVLTIILLYVSYVYRKKDCDSKLILLYLAIAVIPYIRYVVMNNHSYLHRFFTYRAQLASIMAIILAATDMVDRRMLVNVFHKRRKH